MWNLKNKQTFRFREQVGDFSTEVGGGGVKNE